MKYRPEIDGLRAIAVGAVIADHAGAPLHGGFLGVDIFFVISGFLITTILIRELDEGRFSLARFYERRARRILPALILVVAVSLPFAWALMSPAQLKLFSQSLVALTLFATNFLYWQKSGYFAPAADENPMLHTWSLAVEEQFYIFFPLLLLVLWPMGRGRVFLWVMVLSALSLIAAEIGARMITSASFYMLPFRAWELLFGALAAFVMTRSDTGGLHEKGPLQSALAGIGLVLIGVGIFTYTPYMLIPGLAFVLPVGGTVLVLMFARPHNLVGRLLSLPPMVWIGLISYSAYLWHQPVLAFARIASFEALTPLQLGGLVALTFLLAWASWWCVEQPFRKRVPLRAVVGISALAGVAMLGLGLAGHMGNGMPDRYSPAQIAYLQTALPSPKRASCHGHAPTLPPAAEACRYFADTDPTWAVLGDSHGVELAYALGRTLKDRGESLLHLTASGCPPAYDFATDRPGCADWTKRTVDWLTGEAGINTVVLIHRHALYLYGRNEDGEPLPDRTYRLSDPGSDTERRAAYWASLEQMVAQLKAAGKRVIMVEPMPEIRRHIDRHVLHGHVARTEDLRTVTRAYYDARTKPIRDRFAELGVDVMPTGSLICDATDCFGTRNGKALYFDDNHMSLHGAALFVGRFFQHDTR